jgi:hypothetical protein
MPRSVGGEIKPSRLLTYSVQHIQFAALFSRLSANIEKNFGGKVSSELSDEYWAYVTGAIFFAVSFLEATINELFADTADDTMVKIDSNLWQLEPKAISMMANFWKIAIKGKPRFSILEKYQVALILTDKPKFDTDINPYQDVSHLVNLRNALIHYKPEWIPHLSGTNKNEMDPHKFEKMLKVKFKENPMAGVGDPFFPDKCLGHGCAEWAVRSSINFVDDFFSRLGLTPRFNRVRDNLKTE